MYDLRRWRRADLLRHRCWPDVVGSGHGDHFAPGALDVSGIMQQDYIKTAEPKAQRTHRGVCPCAEKCLPTFINIVALQMGYLWGSLFAEVIFLARHGVPALQLDCGQCVPGVRPV
jgi:hypothetical protein